MRNPNRFLALAAVAAVALGAAACGGDDAGDATDAASSAVAGAASSVEAAASSAEVAASSAVDAASSAVDSATSEAAPETSAAVDLSSLSGQVVIDGSSTVEPISTAVAEAFKGVAGGVEVSVGTSGTGGGFEKFCKGETDISDASRPIKDEEAQACADGGIEHIGLQIGVDGLTIAVNPENDWAQCLTIEQLAQMWGPDATAKSWKDIDPSFPDEPLVLFGPDSESGTYDFFNETVLGKDDAGEVLVPRQDYTPSTDDNVTVQGIEGDKGALGYFGIAYFEANADQLRAVQIDGGSGCVEPSKETVKDGSYQPLSRPLFFYVSKAAAARPEVKGFVDFYLEQAPALVDQVGYVPVDEAQFTQDKADWAAFAG